MRSIFGLAAQLYECAVDPTGGSIIRARGSKVLDWCLRMNEPRDDGAFESWDALEPTLRPLLDYVGRYFLPWTVANVVALQAGEKSFSVELAGKAYVQPPQKYHAKSLAVLREKYRSASGNDELDKILEASGCNAYLA